MLQCYKNKCNKKNNNKYQLAVKLHLHHLKWYSNSHLHNIAKDKINLIMAVPNKQPTKDQIKIWIISIITNQVSIKFKRPELTITNKNSNNLDYKQNIQIIINSKSQIVIFQINNRISYNNKTKISQVKKNTDDSWNNR